MERGKWKLKGFHWSGSRMIPLRKAFTIFELAVVLFVIAALAGLSFPIVGGTYNDAATASTQSTLQAVSNATAKYWSDNKLVKLDGVTTVASESTRFQVRWLFRNPATNLATTSFDRNSAVGWNGPYLLSSTGTIANFGDTTIIDAWNHEITIQDVDPAASLRDVRVVSAGPDGIVNIPSGTATTSLNASNIGDDLYVALQLR